MDHLAKLENESIYIIREAYKRFRNMAMLWSIGKDSTTLLWLARKAFLGRLPFPVVHIDTGFKFKEIYDFREKYRKAWSLDLIMSRNEAMLRKGTSPSKGKFLCCDALKTGVLKETIRRYGFKALLLGIRRDEHGIRAKERCFSPRDAEFKWDYEHQLPELWDLYKKDVPEGEHLRIHPLLHWAEIDIWRYIKKEKIPTVSLYFAVAGKRFRSIGCQPCCSPIASKANSLDKILKELETTKISERGGRSQDKEDAYTMQKLRSLGYM
jgi:sulfate adenylyltransferase subunit 2